MAKSASISDLASWGAQDDNGAVTMGDRARAFGAGVSDVGTSVASGARALADATNSPNAAALADFFRTTFKGASGQLTDDMSQETRDQLQDSITSPEFWKHPVSAAVLKTLNMAPSVAAAVVPAALFPEGVAAQLGVIGSGAALGAGQSASDVYDQTDALDDQQLQMALPYYGGLRSMGVPEETARAQANTKLMGLKPLLNAAASGAAMALGPAGRLAGIIPEGAGAGLLARAGVGAGEGAAGGALMGGVGEATREQTQIDLDQRTQMDPSLIAAAAVDSGVTMGAMGAVGGVLTRAHGDAPPTLRTVEQVDTRSPDAAQSLALSANQDVRAPAPPSDTTSAAPPAAEVTLAGNTPAPAPPAPPAPHIDDAGQTVPEAQPTLDAQREQLINGQRQAMLYPKGGAKPSAPPPGMKYITTKDGTFHYNPALVKPKSIYDASKTGDLNNILALGDYSKNDVAAKVAAGEPAVAVTERQPNGTEVKAAAGTPSTAPDQVASLEATKTAGNTVQVEPPQQVLADREAAAKAAADSLRQKPTFTATAGQIANEHAAEVSRLEAEGTKNAAAKLKPPTPEPAPAPKAVEPPVEGGKNRTKAEREQRLAHNELAGTVINQYLPHPGEAQFFSQGKGIVRAQARTMILERARAMVDAAEKAGIKIQRALKDSKDKSMEPSPGMVLLTEAKALVSERGKGATNEKVERFVTRELQLRSNDEADRQRVLSERRAEGARVMEARGKTPEELADNANEVEGAAEAAPETPAEDAGPMQEPLSQDREKVTLKGNEVNAVKDRTADIASGKIKVETKKRRQLKRLGGKGETSSEDIIAQDKFLKSVKPDHTMSYGAALGQTTRAGYKSGLDMAISRHVVPQLRRVVGDMQVHFISDADMDAFDHFDGGADEEYGRTEGFFSRPETADGQAAIYVRSSNLLNPAKLRYVLTHEGIHAATMDAMMRRGPEFRDAFEQMMRDARAHVGNEVANSTYGFKDPYEFMAEAISNPHFQQMLGESPASPELVEKLGLGKLSTLKDAVVQFVRKLLGLPADSYSALEAALKFHNSLIEEAQGRSRTWEPPSMAAVKRVRMGDFSPAGNQAHSDEINGMFKPTLAEAVNRRMGNSSAAAKDFVSKVTSPAKLYSASVESAHTVGGVFRKMLNAVTTNDQYRAKIEKLIPMAKEIFDANEKTGVYANKLKEEGVDLTAMLVRAQKENPELFAKFAKLVNDQTMHGVDASAAIGAGRNAHLQLPKSIEEKLAKGEHIDDLAHEAAMKTWQAREQHPELQRQYKEIIKADPRYADMQSHLFDFYDKAQSATVRDQVERILENYGYKGTDQERAADAKAIYQGKLNDAVRADIASKLEGDGDSALRQIEATKALRVVDGPYSPQMRRGDHAIIGEYKVAEPKNGTKIDDSTWEFKGGKDSGRQAAHDFAVNSALHAEPKVVYYDTATGERVKSREDAISQSGEPEMRYQIKLQRQHLEFHEKEADARARLEELKNSGLFNKVGLEERRHILSEQDQFSGRGVESLLRSLATQKKYQDSTEAQRDALRATIREAGIRAMSDNRIQSRRLPRRYVGGASDDIARNLYDYNNSQANYRAQMKFRQEKDDGLKAMWDHVAANRYQPDNQARSAAANEVEKRMRAPDPNQFSGPVTDWTRRLTTWSYIDRMARPSHLIIDHTHLPMITAPYMAGRHGLMNSFGSTLKAWKELTGFYKTGGADFADAIVNALHKGSNYADVYKAAFKDAPDGKRLAQMVDAGTELGWIHPSSGIEVHKNLPSKQAGGVLGGLDNGLSRVDTVFRQLMNSMNAVNRMAGATAAYRMEFKKLTQAGKSEAQAHEAAVEYARKVITDTQGLYSSTNAAPLFKNKFLKPLLQFKQYPQMMYHLLSKLAVQSFKGETREAKVEAMASLGAILGMHMMMAGVLQGLPLEPFKLLGLISKGIGLTDGDWTDVENAVTRKLNDTFGKEAGGLMTRGLGAQMGVDVHHRLGLNSFVTYGLPEQLDSKSVSEFMMNAVAGAPGGMVTDAVKGTHKMLTGDIEGGALQAFPLQAFRDIHNAIAPADNTYGYQPTAADRVKSLIGFTPEAKAIASEKKEQVYNAVQNYDAQRSNFIKAWTSAAPGERDQVWEKIQAWNQGQPAAARLNKGQLFKSLQGQAAAKGQNNTVANIRTNSYNKAAAQSAADLYP